MRVSTLDLANFRNYAALHIEPPSGVCVFIGDNAQGKSNLLEAISLLATGKSFRVAREADLVRTACPLARVAARVTTKTGDVQAACMITRVGDGARKRFLRNGRTVAYAQFLGGINAVTFMPADLQLITGPPALRRRFLNVALSQADRGYYRQHARYSGILMQKNALLKTPGGIDRGLLATYNEQLAEVGAQLVSARAAYIRGLARAAADVHATWVGDAAPLRLSYAPSPPLPDGDESPGALSRAFERAWATLGTAELTRKTSLVGPHRDDLQFALGEQPLARFGSQGQQRTAVLALKSAEYALLAAATGEAPLLLLDDVLSELDADRRRSFLRSIEGCEQAFITATEAPDFESGLAVSVFAIEEGRLSPRTPV